MTTKPMSEQSFEACRDHVEPHDHAVFVYDDAKDILLPLDQFIADGLRHNDLAVFVHSFPGRDAARGFLAGGVNSLTKLEAEGHLTSSFYQEAFERGGHIDHDHAGAVVKMLQDTAARTGHRAPRVFVDASKNYFDAGRIDEWFAFEAWLGPKLQAKVGLVCAYRASDLRDPTVLRRVLETHSYRFDSPARP